MRPDWKDRLNNWAPEPPAGAWEKLSEALPEAPPAYAQKLYSWEPTPPPETWEKIASQLTDVPPRMPIVRMYSNKKWVQVASVAASILFALVLLQPYFSNEKTTVGGREKNLPVAEKSLLPLDGLLGNKKEPVKVSPTSPAAEKTVVVQNLVAKTTLPPKSKKPLPTLKPDKPAPEQFAVTPKSIFSITNYDFLDRYMIVASDDDAVRLQRKLYTAYHCNEQPDPAACLERLATLRRQLAAPSLLVSSDFAGLMEVVQQVSAR